jgi:hypothetical protein
MFVALDGAARANSSVTARAPPLKSNLGIESPRPGNPPTRETGNFERRRWISVSLLIAARVGHASRSFLRDVMPTPTYQFAGVPVGRQWQRRVPPMLLDDMA